MMNAAGINDRRNTNAMRWSLGIGILMLGGKSLAYWLTGSAAILSDALESVIHLAAVAFAAISLHLSQSPAKENSPYGYGRIAFVSAGFEGGMISIAAFGIIALAVQKWLAGLELEQLGRGTLITLAASLINLALGLYLVRTGRSTRSLILEANGKHVLTDSWTSFGIVFGLSLVLLTGWKPLDPLIAILVALNILWSAWGLMARSVRGLLDIVDPAVNAKLHAVAEQAATELGIQQHQLRPRDTGEQVIADVHLLFPRAMPLGQAHSLATEFERLLAQRVDFPIEIVSHLESIEDHDEIHNFTRVT
jgi:cation diffusion facilitator family transporter